ncbi:MAG: 30S ribosomal protein S1, partial [Zetaproteobacteria bacterium CG23_combo_of_CG06-09_8_20_14_all_54_7]
MSEAEKLDKVQDTDTGADVTDTPATVADAVVDSVPEETIAAAADTEAVVESAAAASDESDAEAAPSADDEDSFRLMYEASLKEKSDIRIGEMVTGMVVGLNADVVVIDVGTKAEGTIPLAEFAQAGMEVPAIGTEIKALIQSVGGSSGVSLSVLAIRQREAWAGIEAAVTDESTVDAVITAEVKGGYRVSLSGLNAFMPR